MRPPGNVIRIGIGIGIGIGGKPLLPDPLGQPLRIRQATPPEQTFEVVAVVRDVPTTGLGTDVRPQVDLPLPQALTEIRGVTRSVSVVLDS